jgi:hypothetical protein
MTLIDPSKPYGLNHYLATTPAPEGAKNFPSAISIYCDACGITQTADYVVNDHMTRFERFQVARNYLNAEAGWQCNEEADLCSRCASGDQ